MIAVAGAGVAGLTAARVLHEAGRDVEVFEAAGRPGGRIASRKLGGFTLDRGFQVLLTSYRTVWEMADIASLEPRFFDSGAILLDEGRLWTVRHPLAHPHSAPFAVFSRAFHFADKARILKWGAWSLLSRELEPVERRKEVSAIEELRRAGFSPSAIERFFRPFFGGVLLDSRLASSAALLRFYFQRFAFGRAFVPAAGMGEFPARLASSLPAGAIHFDCPVERLESSSEKVRAIVAGGQKREVEGVILATDSLAASCLLGLAPPPPGPDVWTVFFRASESLYTGRLIVLPAGRGRLVRHFVQMTNAAPEYAPPGSHLIVATILDSRGLSPAAMACAAAADVLQRGPRRVIVTLG
ncbi:MAG: FAD-dependent oxidoreductase, partial [Terrimicrobiaceae bacterium]|nr:FAD-dependent oxidoreductase [Terrimicrobiaceae bacterium]